MNEKQKSTIDALYRAIQYVYRAIEEKDLDSYNQAIMEITDEAQLLNCLDESEIE